MKHIILFQENQRFTQWWLWITLIGVAFIPTYGLYKQLIVGEKFGSKPISDSGLIIMAAFIFSFIVFFLFLRLKTEIDINELRMTFFPLAQKKVVWKEVDYIKIVNYGFIGLGIGFTTKYGNIYNVKGNKGLAILLKNGKMYVIGTQKPDELEKIIQNIKVGL